MRAVLDFREVNAASVPDRYTIREVRDCMDEIGLARSTVISTIDLSSGFWQQSLDPASRHYTSFTVPGKGTRFSLDRNANEEGLKKTFSLRSVRS